MFLLLSDQLITNEYNSTSTDWPMWYRRPDYGQLVSMLQIPVTFGEMDDNVRDEWCENVIRHKT